MATILLPQPNPVTSYNEAVERFGAMSALDDSKLNPVTKSMLLTHGHKTGRVVVYFHGYTNAPTQFAALGQLLFERGDTVLVPRLRYHGLADRMTTEQAKLTAADLVQTTDETLDIAQGLGERVVVAGLSAGGVMAAWAAQFRSDVDRAVLIAPSFGLAYMPAWISHLVGKTARRLPNAFIWWDRQAKANIVGPTHAYPRFSTRALAQVFVLGDVVQAAATTAPRTDEIVLITTATDTAVSNTTAVRIAKLWEDHSGRKVERYEFSHSQQIFHDMIDPQQPTQKTEIVYPVLLKYLQ